MVSSAIVWPKSCFKISPLLRAWTPNCLVIWQTDKTRFSIKANVNFLNGHQEFEIYVASGGHDISVRLKGGAHAKSEMERFTSVVRGSDSPWPSVKFRNRSTEGDTRTFTQQDDVSGAFPLHEKAEALVDITEKFNPRHKMKGTSVKWTLALLSEAFVSLLQFFHIVVSMHHGFHGNFKTCFRDTTQCDEFRLPRGKVTKVCTKNS